jgi:hypothetical protein
MERYSDLADEAERIEREILEKKIAELRARSRELKLDNPSGICWNCESETGIARRFCNIVCAREWEADQ